jgi:hypothetical protein
METVRLDSKVQVARLDTNAPSPDPVPQYKAFACVVSWIVILFAAWWRLTLSTPSEVRAETLLRMLQ